ncbi:MAG TPA: crosslink repair DNA glycosylase YcaQ family protein [Thermoanaerobaculia bacterium]|nr:crosslink repair DNA glycosylase YcaQ family protein [Thermoanaerobaculia bacterium]
MARPAAALPSVSAETARLLMLDAQGLLASPERATADAVYRLVERLGFVQIDSINSVGRAHHLILAVRLRGYRPSLLERLLEQNQRRLFEHWTHDAAAIPTVWFPHWRWRFERYRRRVRGHRWWQERLGDRPERLLRQIRQRLANEGPLLARDFAVRRAGTDLRESPPARPSPDERRPAMVDLPADPRLAAGERTGSESSWWGWQPHKAALEYLWMVGEVAIAGRRNFHKLYDLAERVLPEAWAAPRSSRAEHLEWACGSALQRLGVATPEEIAGYWQAVTAREARDWCGHAAARGAIAAVAVEGADGSPPRPAFAPADWQERLAALPAASSRLRLLCPFDPILHDRRRTLRLFHYDYRFEAFVPAARRRHGYYVMPILEGSRLVGRLDPKLHREQRLLEVRAVWWEPGVRTTRRRRLALETAVGRLARSLGAERWSLPRTTR